MSKTMKYAELLPWMFAPALLLLCLGCARDEEKTQDPVVAQVGDKIITLAQLQEYSSKIPEYLQSQRTGIKKERNHLQTMIDKEILLMEAANQEIEKSPDFMGKMYKTRKDALVSAFQSREIKVNVKFEEIQETFEKEGYSRAISFNYMRIEDRDEARAALEELRAGKNFEEVAEQWSAERKAESRIGDMGRYSTRADMNPALRDRLFSLEVGAISEAIPFYDIFLIYKVVGDTTVSINEQMVDEIYKEIFAKEHTLQINALVEKLKNSYRLELVREGLTAFLEKWRSGSSFATAAERNITIYRYDGGEITAKDFMDVIGSLKSKPRLASDEEAIAFAEHSVVPDLMFLSAALRAGIDEEKKIVKYLKKQRKQFLLIDVRKRVLEGKLEVSDEEVRQHYDNNTDMYMLSEVTAGQEIMVETREEALRLKEEIQQGAPMGELAKAHSIRSMRRRDEEGRFSIRSFEGALYDGLLEATEEVPLGELTGPVELEHGYSIFKVVSRKREREPFSTAQKRVKATIRWMRKQEIFEEFMVELRNKYASEVSVHEVNLKAAFSAG